MLKRANGPDAGVVPYQTLSSRTESVNAAVLIPNGPVAVQSADGLSGDSSGVGFCFFSRFGCCENKER